MAINNITKLILSIALPLAVGGISGYFTAEAIPTWYATLKQPSFNPPNWIFAPVWTTLYILMGVGLYLIWKMPATDERDLAIISFLIQLLFNFAWSFYFFYLKNIPFALVVIIALWLAIAAMLFLFYKQKPIAAYINIPYLCWVSFATVLNFAYFQLNG